MDTVLDHEERFWEARAGLEGVVRDFERSKARQVVAAATLREGLGDFDTAVRVAERLFREGTLSADGRVLLRLLQRTYQRQDAGGSVYLPALEPDLLGEGMVLRVASPKQAGERPPVDGIDRVFPLSEGEDAVGTGFEVLGRASATTADGVRPWIERLLAASLDKRAGLAFGAAKAVGLRTAYSVLGDVLAEQLEKQGGANLARELEAAGIPYPTVSLRRVAEWVSRTLLSELQASEDERVLAERARRRSNLGVRLSALGRREEALKATQEAVELRRALRQRQPDAFQPDLAMSLNNLGDTLNELEKRQEALAAYEEALDMLWPFFKRLPSAFMQKTGFMIRDLLQIHEALQRPLPPMLKERSEEFMRLAGLHQQPD
jgi:tetratricopeptide (TPR) repeat protein